MKKQERGITLVALIITIAVLVTLAMIAIFEISNNNIILHATDAAQEYKEEQNRENTVIDQYEIYFNGDHTCDFNKQVASARYRISQEVKDYCTYYYSCSCGKSSMSTTFVYHNPDEYQWPPDYGYVYCPGCQQHLLLKDKYGNTMWESDEEDFWVH